jgi:hypothetical protein
MVFLNSQYNEMEFTIKLRRIFYIKIAIMEINASDSQKGEY